MRNRLANYWFYYRDDLRKFIKDPRVNGLYFGVPAVVTVATMLNLWCFVLLVLPFLYSLYPAYQSTKISDRPAVWTC